MPEEARLATAMITLQALAEFIRDKFPGYLAAFTEILTPFGARLPDMIATAK